MAECTARPLALESRHANSARPVENNDAPTREESPIAERGQKGKARLIECGRRETA